MLGVVAGLPRYRERPRRFRMNEVPVAALAAAIHKPACSRSAISSRILGGIGVARHKHNVLPPQLRYTVGAAGYRPLHLRDAMQSW